MASFDAFRFVDLIAPRPILLIVGTEAVTSWMTVEAYQRAAQGPKGAALERGRHHVDLYDKPEYVDPAIEKLAVFYTHHLGS